MGVDTSTSFAAQTVASVVLRYLLVSITCMFFTGENPKRRNEICFSSFIDPFNFMVDLFYFIFSFHLYKKKEITSIDIIFQRDKV